MKQYHIPDFRDEQKIQLKDIDHVNTLNFIIQEKVRTERLFSYFEVKDFKSGQIYLAKILKRNKEKYHTQNYEQFEQNLLNEVNILRQLDHPTIVKYIGYTPNGIDEKHQPSLITEYGPRGLLSNIIQSIGQGKPPSGWDDTKKLINIIGIASAISYLHTLNVLHRNLNSQNIYESEEFHPLVSNFENSVVIHDDEETYPDKGKTIGLVMYIAPEILKDQIYSKSSDIYSFGMIVYEIMSNSIPFEGLEVEDIKQNIIKGERPTIDDSIPKVYKELIEQCWSQNPNDRPIIKDILTRLTEDEKFIKPTVDKNKIKDFTDRSIIDVPKPKSLGKSLESGQHEQSEEKIL